MALQKGLYYLYIYHFGALDYTLCVFITRRPWMGLYSLFISRWGGDLDNALCLFSLGPLDYKNFFVVSRLETLDYLY